MLPLRMNAGKSNQVNLNRVKELLSLSDGKQRTILRGLGRKQRSKTRGNIKAQKNLDGSSYARRKDPNNNKKMFRKLGRSLVVQTGETQTRIAWAQAGTGMIARQHQEGLQQVFTAAKAARKYGSPKYSDPSTRKQAKALLAEGFKTRRKVGKKGKTKWVRPTQKWILENITLGQAGLILREMRNSQPKKKWSIQLASRTLLGATDKEVNEMLDDILLNMKEKAKK